MEFYGENYQLNTFNFVVDAFKKRLEEKLNQGILYRVSNERATRAYIMLHNKAGEKFRKQYGDEFYRHDPSEDIGDYKEYYISSKRRDEYLQIVTKLEEEFLATVTSQSLDAVK